jgi:hypothetical protein
LFLKQEILLYRGFFKKILSLLGISQFVSIVTLFDMDCFVPRNDGKAGKAEKQTFPRCGRLEKQKSGLSPVVEGWKSRKTDFPPLWKAGKAEKQTFPLYQVIARGFVRS